MGMQCTMGATALRLHLCTQALLLHTAAALLMYHTEQMRPDMQLSIWVAVKLNHRPDELFNQHTHFFASGSLLMQAASPAATSLHCKAQSNSLLLQANPQARPVLLPSLLPLAAEKPKPL
jgi:glycine cleavage system regulatory protein